MVKKLNFKKYKDFFIQGLVFIVPCIVVFSICFMSFSRFSQETEETVEIQNKKYIKEFTLEIANKLDEKFATSISSVSAIAKMNAEELVSEKQIGQTLEDIERETQFDHVRYVDKKGISHTSARTTTDVSDRIYYTDGIKGNKGSTYITNSRLTNQRQIGFYAPVIWNNQISGVVVAFYDECNLIDSINYEIYGEKASTGIISTDGKMVINSPAEDFEGLYSEGLPEDINSLLDSGCFDEENRRKIEEAYKSLSETDFEINFGDGTSSIGYTAPVKLINLNVYMVFPDSVNKAMYENGIKAGRNLKNRLISIFLALIVYMLIIAFLKLFGWKKVHDKLVVESTVDELTELLNRRAYENDLRLLFTDIPQDFVYVSIDINGLKTANDTKGHAAGDELIEGAADCLKKCFGKYGKIYRTGGDEFAAVLSIKADMLEDVKDRLNQTVMSWKGKYTNELCMSCGYVTADEIKNLNMFEATRLADERMYKDKSEFYKKTGRDRRRT